MYGGVDTTPQDDAKNKFFPFPRNNEKMRLMPHFNWIFLLSAKPISTVPMYADEIGLTNSETFSRVFQRVKKMKK